MRHLIRIFVSVAVVFSSAWKTSGVMGGQSDYELYNFSNDCLRILHSFEEQEGVTLDIPAIYYHPHFKQIISEIKECMKKPRLTNKASSCRLAHYSIPTINVDTTFENGVLKHKVYLSEVIKLKQINTEELKELLLIDWGVSIAPYKLPLILIGFHSKNVALKTPKRIMDSIAFSKDSLTSKDSLYIKCWYSLVGVLQSTVISFLESPAYRPESYENHLSDCEAVDSLFELYNCLYHEGLNADQILDILPSKMDKIISNINDCTECRDYISTILKHIKNSSKG